MRAAVAESPDSMPEAWRATTSAMELLIEKVSSGGSRACLLADMDLTRREFGYANASAVERVLIDAIVAARLRLAVIEHGYAEKGFNTVTSGYWENLINNAQFRLLRAVESLARAAPREVFPGSTDQSGDQWRAAGQRHHAELPPYP